MVAPHDHKMQYFIGQIMIDMQDIGNMEPLHVEDVLDEATMRADLGREIVMVAIATDCACCT